MIHTRLKLEIRWIAYVIMPEHVHLLVLPIPLNGSRTVSISSVLQHLKQFVGRHGKQALRSIWRNNRSLGSPAMDSWALSSRTKPFWKTRGYDFNISEECSLSTKLDYIHKNPVTRQLVDNAMEWQWSSYRFYECNDSTKIKMDWDGAWPIV